TSVRGPTVFPYTTLFRSGYDDAIYAGARLIELLSRSETTLEQHVDSLPVLHNTPEIRREVSDEGKFEIVRRAVARFRKLPAVDRSEEHTSELQSRGHLVC